MTNGNPNSIDEAEPQHSRTPCVVIVGGGFGGLAAAKAFRKTPTRNILVDRTNHHVFQPLLYQVATLRLITATGTTVSQTPSAAVSRK